jgi:uncharacterized delta-60 repeat protein
MKPPIQHTLLALALAALALNLSAIPEAKAASWVNTGPLTTARRLHTATLLPNGKVLVAGGFSSSDNATNSAELYDPATAAWVTTPASPMTTTRALHTATLLPNGKVLVAGGNMDAAGNPVGNSAELYDPATGTWTATSSMTFSRIRHTATLLSNGKVLVTGGWSYIYGGAGFAIPNAELYDPANGTWTPTASMPAERFQHTATLLPNGKVLVFGGRDKYGDTASDAYLYDPASGTWTANYPGLNSVGHTATLLPNGKVLVAGGSLIDGAELYDPATEYFTSTGSMTTERGFHTATLLPNGKVLVTGGTTNATLSAELYDPASGTWTAANDLMASECSEHTATLLPNGKVLVAGGSSNTPFPPLPPPLASAELYDSATGTWTVTGTMTAARWSPTATLLPDGTVLVVGGYNDSSGYLSSAEYYHHYYLPGHWVWGWTLTGSLNNGRAYHTATLLANGKVLVAGGETDYVTYRDAQLYDPATGAWTGTGSMTTNRVYHTATLLPNGKLLVAGGEDNSGNVLSSAELYDPATGAWTATGSMTTARAYHTATLLPNGKVLVAGGEKAGYLISAELYNPASGTWTATGTMGTARAYHTATLLPNGRVLIAGGYGSSGVLNSAERYNPDTGTWTATPVLTTARYYHTATLLPNGKVLVAGGYGSSGNLSSAELYDPATGYWTATGSMTTARQGHTATLLPNGQVLVAGGLGSSGCLSSAELYDVGLGFSSSWQPQIATCCLGSCVALTGSQFRGVSEGSGGNGSQDSPADYPVVQLRSLGNEQTLFLLSTSWSTNSFSSAPVTNFPTGYALVTMFVNGIPSTSSIIVLSLPNLTITFVKPNSVVVSWLNTGSYTLQQNSNLAGGSWTTSGYTITTSNGTNSVTVTPPTGNLFFRLKQ